MVCRNSSSHHVIADYEKALMDAALHFLCEEFVLLLPTHETTATMKQHFHRTEALRLYVE